MNKLNHHLRQYRHNNSDGLVAGYEQEGTEAFVSCLEQEIAELKAMVNYLRDGSADLVYMENNNKRSTRLGVIMSRTKQQCLASVKADAVDKFIETQWSPTICTQDLIDYAKKLREQKS